MYSIVDNNYKFIICLVLTFLSRIICDQYKIGAGIADITGPASDINMMGYAKLGQDAAGIHTRLYSRAIIAEDSNGHRVCIVTCDLAMVSQIVKLEVNKILEQKYNGIYKKDNVMITSTHTHSGPGGYLQYLLYIITTKGFVDQSFNAIRDGIVKSIDRAHNSMTDEYIYINSGQLLYANINRSPTAYANNPQIERDQYSYDTDKTMTILKFTDLNGGNIAVLSSFPVHATSMNNTNQLISGDNKGYASLLFEQTINGGTIPGKGPFVAMFPQSNMGDVSPNTNGPRCLDTDEPCDIATSTCNGNNGNCVASGPGKDMFESTKIIGSKQYTKAKQLYDSAVTQLSGPIKFIHQTVDMSDVTVKLADNSTVKTCKAAMGASFAAGTTDGPGAFPFKQGDSTTSNPLWNVVSPYMTNPSAELIDCQFPKPIRLPTGELNLPYPWQPSILPTQVFQVGNTLIMSVPGEFTTMSGRRIKDAIKKKFDINSPNSNVTVLMCSVANAYSSYITTFEEYQIQRYEGASTIYGPHTLEAYIQQYENLVTSLATGQALVPGPEEPNFLPEQIRLDLPVIADTKNLSATFGYVIDDANSEYTVGSIVTVSFVAGSPRNDLRTENTFITVERKNNITQVFDVIATDANWETRFYWKRNIPLVALGNSVATIYWEIPNSTLPGDYRIRHFGNYKTVLGILNLQQIKPYSGTSRTFKVKLP